MLSAKLLKYLLFLHKKKGRQQENCFIVEGDKIVNELFSSGLNVIYVIHTAGFHFLAGNKQMGKWIEVSKRDMDKISCLSTPTQVLAVVEIPGLVEVDMDARIILALDGIRDPGNMGTLVRLAEWFGVRDILCSKDCVEIYNPKVVQASMGSIFRVNIVYQDLAEGLLGYPQEKVGAVLGGEDAYQYHFAKKSILVIGSESHGISEQVKQVLDKKITIPCFSQSIYPESLNAASAAAILLSLSRA